MAKNNKKQHFVAKPIERHDTAAWANIQSEKGQSKVTMPAELQVRNAKEYVDANEK